MKRRIMIAILCLSMLMTATACGKKDQKEQQDAKQRSNVIETDSETNEKYYLMADFENYFECTQIKYEAAFGTIKEVEKSDKPEYVTYGNQSAKLEIQGTSTQWGARWPQMRISTATDFFDLTEDFSNMTKFTFDIYSDMDYEVTMRFAVDDRVGSSRKNYHFSYLQIDENRWDNVTNKITLQPKQWNHVEISVDEIKVMKDYVMTYGSDALSQVGAFVLIFDRGEVHDTKQVYYIDNIRAYFDGEPIIKEGEDIEVQQ